MAENQIPPMPTPTVPNKPFSTFKVLSFDIYGTLVDWESSIITRLNPLLSRIPPQASKNYATYSPKSGLSQAQLKQNVGPVFTDIEKEIQTDEPTLRYDKLLAKTYIELSRRLDVPPPNGSQEENNADTLEAEAEAFGTSIGTWTAFPDTVDAMVRLSKYFKLVPLSNVDRESFFKTSAGPLEGRIDWWRVYTAQDIGSYKPDLKNFEYLFRHVDEDDRSEGGKGIAKQEVCQVAQSLFHDHVPAKKMGMSSVWINRQGAGMGSAGGGVAKLHEKGEVGYGWRFATLGEFADEVERQLAT